MAATLLWPFLFFVESVVCVPSRWNVFACVEWRKIPRSAFVGVACDMHCALKSRHDFRAQCYVFFSLCSFRCHALRM